MMASIEQFTNDWPVIGGLVGTLLILVITWAIERVVAHFVWKFLKRDDNDFVAYTIIVNIIKFFIWVIGIAAALDYCFKIDVTGIIAALGVGGIAVSLGCKDTIANLIGGIQITLMRLIKPNDRVLYGDVLGRVQDVTWRHTTIRNPQGDIEVIPNSVMNTASFVHYPDIVRVEAPFYVSPSRVSAEHTLDQIADEVKKVAEEAARAVEPLVGETVVIFTESQAYGYPGKVLLYIEGINANERVFDPVVRAIANLDLVNVAG